MALFEQALNLLIDFRSGGFAIFPALRKIVAQKRLVIVGFKCNQTQVPHTPASHHAPRQASGLDQVVFRARRDISNGDLIGCPALYSPGSEPLGPLLYYYYLDGQYGRMAAVGIVISLICIILVAFAQRFSQWERR